MRVLGSLKFLLLSLAVFSVVVLFLPRFIAPVHAYEPKLETILIDLGFENTSLTDVETWSAGTYNVTLYAEFAGWHDENELSYYELNDPDVFNVIFYGPEGATDIDYVVPPINKSFTADYEFGLSMLSKYNRRYFTQNSRNGDGKIHSIVYENLDDPGMYLIGFENTWNGGDQDYNDMVFSLKPYAPPVNTPPSISGLPDLELDEDGSLDNAIDLWDYASDAETPDENLDFTILSVTEPDVGVTLDSNRYIDVQPTANWHGTSEVTVEVSDGELTDTDSFIITVNPVNDPPVLAPLPDQTLDEDTTLPDAFDLDDYGSDVDGDPLTYSIIGNTNPEVGVSIDSENKIDIAPEADWYGSSIVTIQVSDDLLTDSEDFTITVNPVNDPPTAPVVDVTPDYPVTTDNLVCTIITESIDPDGDPISYFYEWYKNDVPQTGYTTNTVPASATTKDDVWKCIVTPYDGTVNGTSAQDQVTIGNSPPSIDGVNVTPDPAYETSTLLATPYGWYDADGDSPGYMYQWYKNGAPISGATSATLTGSDFDKGDQIYCEVTPWDGTDTGTPVNSNTVTILNSPPSAPVVDVTPDSPVTGDDLTCTVTTQSTDADSDIITYTYRWYKDGALQTALTTTTTALSVTIDSSNTAKGDVWKCVVTPNDGTADGSSGEDQVTIGNTPPTAPVVDVTPDLPVTTDDLVCTITTASTDPDGDPITYFYEWYKNDVLQSGYTTNTVPASATEKGDVWKCVVTPYDGTDYGPPDEDQVTIPNSPPVLDPIGDKTVDEETELSFTATASDPDEEPLTFSLGAGAPSGASITSGGDFTWTPTEAQGPGTYPVRIIVSDGTAEDSQDITVTVYEVNLPPVLNPIGPKTVYEGALLQFTVTASDPDIPAQTLTYSASNLPPGATFNPDTRVFSWTPTSGQAGVYPNVHFEVSDGDLKDSEDITITVTTVKPPVGGYAAPINIDIDKNTFHLLAPHIGLAFALLAAIAVTILLTKRRSKTLK